MSVKQAKSNQGFLKKGEVIEEKRELKSLINEDVWAFFNETQLWFIYLGLDRLQLEPDLQIGVKDLARRLHNYGERKYDWDK